MSEKLTDEQIRAIEDRMNRHQLAMERLSESDEQRQSAWHPIETAPNGTPVLVCDPTRPDGIVVAFQLKHGTWVTVPGRYGFNPTHWTPLPDPPKPTDA